MGGCDLLGVCLGMGIASVSFEFWMGCCTWFRFAGTLAFGGVDLGVYLCLVC